MAVAVTLMRGWLRKALRSNRNQRRVNKESFFHGCHEDADKYATQEVHCKRAIRKGAANSFVEEPAKPIASRRANSTADEYKHHVVQGPAPSSDSSRTLLTKLITILDVCTTQASP